MPTRKTFWLGLMLGALVGLLAGACISPWHFYTGGGGRLLWRVNRLTGHAAWSTPESTGTVWHPVNKADAHGFELVPP